VVGGVAVNKLLLSERQKSSGLDEVTTLEGSSGGERPAGSTLSLVLDSVDGSSGSPVETSGRSRARSRRRSVTLVARERTVGDHVTRVSGTLTGRSPRRAVLVHVLAGTDLLGRLSLLSRDESIVVVWKSSSEHLSILVVSEIGKVVVSKLVGRSFLRVMLLDDTVHLHEQSTSLKVLHEVVVGLSVLSDECLELSFHLGSEVHLRSFNRDISLVLTRSPKGASGTNKGDREGSLHSVYYLIL
jgi:hypothetical protein